MKKLPRHCYLGLMEEQNKKPVEPRLQQFMDAWKQEFGEELTPGEARIHLHELVEFYLLVARPIPEESDTEGRV